MTKKYRLRTDLEDQEQVGGKQALDDKHIDLILCQCDAEIKHDGIFDMQNRIIALGDIHGDLEGLLVCLGDLAEVIKYNINEDEDVIDIEWTGGKTFVVILGDIIDRTRTESIIDDDGYLVGEIDDEEETIINILNILALQAKRKGGRLIKLIGNHEVMNLYGYFNYVSKNTLRNNGGKEGRKALMKPGGKLSNKIIKCGTLGIAKIGSWIFVHGGLLPGLVKSVKRIEKDVKKDIFIKKANQLAENIFYGNVSDIDSKLIKLYYLESHLEEIDRIEDLDNSEQKEYYKKQIEELYNKSNSLLNERRLALDYYGGVKVPICSMCEALRHAFDLLGYDKSTNIVVAHTVQLERGLFNRTDDDNKYISGYVKKKIVMEDDKKVVYGGKAVKYGGKYNAESAEGIFPHGINFECPNEDLTNGHVWRIDTGLSRGFDIKRYNSKNVDPKFIQKILKARRPAVLEIINDTKTRVIIAKKGLTRKWLDDLEIEDEGYVFD